MYETFELFVTTIVSNPELGVFYSLVTMLNLMLFRIVGTALLRVAGVEIGKKKEPDPVFDPLIKRIQESHPDHWNYEYDNGFFKSTTQSGLMFCENKSTSKRKKDVTYCVRQGSVCLNEVLTAKQNKQLNRAIADLYVRSASLSYDRKRVYAAKRLRSLEEDSYENTPA